MGLRNGGLVGGKELKVRFPFSPKLELLIEILREDLLGERITDSLIEILFINDDLLFRVVLDEEPLLLRVMSLGGRKTVSFPVMKTGGFSREILIKEG